MCGLAGFIGAGTSGDLYSMQSALKHRGPDNRGEWTDPTQGIYFAHRRLAVLDPADGAQPMKTADGELVIVYNGEIYNHADLRRELENLGHRFLTSHSDTEVLLHAYRQWGDRLVDHLNGMWAFALLDKRHGQLVLSRDRFGEKPLYYADVAGTFAFASEMTSLLRHSSIVATVDALGLQKYFAHGFNPTPGTIYREILKLPAAHNLTFELSSRSLNIQRYWRFNFQYDETIEKADEVELGEVLLDHIDESVKRRMVADVPVGILLSGGLDSSAITAAACRHGDQVKTFTIGFERDDFDESAFAARVARMLGTEHHTNIADLASVRNAIPGILDRLDDPLGDSSLIPTAMLCKVAREKVTVALAGDGSDELFAGYDPFKALPYAATYARLVPAKCHPLIKRLVGKLPVGHGYMSLDFKIKRAIYPLDQIPALWNPLWLAPLRLDEIAACFSEPYPIEDIFAEAISAWDSCPGDDVIDRTTMFYIELYLQDNILMKTDRASMMHSLEVRAPFLDNDLVSFAAKLPRRFRLRGRTGKYLLRRALRQRLPKEVLKRRKQGFALPIGGWFRDGGLKLDHDSEIPGQESTFVERALAAHRDGHADHRLFLWCQAVLMRHLLAA